MSTECAGGSSAVQQIPRDLMPPSRSTTPSVLLMLVARARHQTDYFSRPIEAYQPDAARTRP